jgi:putative transposase
MSTPSTWPGFWRTTTAVHTARLRDEWAYLFLDGVWLKVRRAAGTKKVLLLVAYGVRWDGSRQLLAFMRAKGESQNAWEGLLNDLQNRGLTGVNLKLIVTDGCAGLAAAIETVYPRVLHQRCWVHVMRNILGKVRKKDYDQVKRAAQAIYLADGRIAAQRAFRRFRKDWQNTYPTMVCQLERVLPELLNFFSFPRECRLIRDYISYYHADRIHDSLEKDTPVMRPVSSKPDQSARLVSHRRVGGLHHRYDWQEAA